MNAAFGQPRLATPMTIVANEGYVHLIAGEDTRYTLTAGDFATLFANLLRSCDGSQSVDDLLERLPLESRPQGAILIQRLYGERVLIDGGPEELGRVSAAEYQIHAEGEGPLVARLHDPPSGKPRLSVLCQSGLDFHSARQFNTRCRQSESPWLWVSTGATERAYVSPVFLANAGPCLTCLLRTFQRLSPAPMLYDVLVDHGKQGGEFQSAPISERVLTILEELVRWKCESFRQVRPVIPVFRLHVLEMATMEVSVHRVFRDPTCPACSHANLG